MRRIQNALYATATLFLFWTLAFSSVHAGPGDISLSPSQDTPLSFHVLQSVNVKMSNAFNVGLKNLTITKASSGARILTIAAFPKGESVSLSFSKTGNYWICYWHNEKGSDNESCLEVNVMKRIAA